MRLKLLIIAFLQIMSSLLPSLEVTLGSLNSWPRDVIQYLFLEPPTQDTVRDLASFFFGNDIPLRLAVGFFQECSSHMPDYIDLFRSHYAAWNVGGNFKYYDVTLGQVIHLHERRVTVVDRGPIEIGLGDNLFPPFVHRRIHDMRQN